MLRHVTNCYTLNGILHLTTPNNPQHHSATAYTDEAELSQNVPFSRGSLSRGAAPTSRDEQMAPFLQRLEERQVRPVVLHRRHLVSPQADTDVARNMAQHNLLFKKVVPESDRPVDGRSGEEQVPIS